MMAFDAPAQIHAIYRAGGFDPATLDGLAQVLGQERMLRLYRITRIEFAESIDRLGRAVAARDIGAALRESHALRGAAANIGAVALADAVARYETSLRAGTFAPALLAEIDAAAAVADRALAQLDCVG